jgi:hypothetical protein
MKRLLTILVVALSVTAQMPAEVTGVVPGPEEVLGFRPGTDRKLSRWREIQEYFARLDVASDRVKVERLGYTTQGRSLIMAVISSPANLRRLEQWRRIQKLLADPRKDGERPERLVTTGKTIVLVTAGIHSTEVASPFTAIQLALELASSSEPETAEILDHVILLLVPSLNPDGVDIVADWYAKTLGTPAEGTSPPLLYHPYAGHDNNRDWFMFTQKETRLLVEKVHNQWHPQIVVDLHQMGPYGARLFAPPFVDPVDPNVDPILQAGIVELGGSIFASLVRGGKKGVLTNAIFDAFTPARAYQHYHGGVRILLEAASARLASPLIVTPEQLSGAPGYHPAESSWNHPVPWTPGEWRISDIIEYQKEAVRACLLHAARYRTRWLLGFRQVALNAISTSPRRSFIIPTQQRDPQALLDLLDVLQTGQVELHQAEADFTARTRLVSPPYGDKSRFEFPKGTIVIGLEQPYGAFARTLLESEPYPMAQSSGRKPYDVTAHNLGIKLGLEVYQVEERPQVPVRQLAPGSLLRELQTVRGVGEYCLFSHENNAFAVLVNRLLKAGSRVQWAPNGFLYEGRGFPTGTLMARFSGDRADLEKLLGSLPVVVDRVEKAPQLAWQEIRRPKIGVYRSHQPSADEGWTRWILEQCEFPYVSLQDKDILRQDLSSSYDVIVFPSQTGRVIAEGLQNPYPEEYRGGLGSRGIERLKQFTRAGGAVLLLGEASGLVEAWGLAVKDPRSTLREDRFYVPGALLKVDVNNRHPIAYGMPEQAAVMFENSPFFALSEGLPVVKYPSEEILLNGWAQGEKEVAGLTALAEIRTGRGIVVLIGFRSQFRAQTRATYKFLFNSLYYATTLRD